MSDFDFEGVFDEDYLYFYEEMLTPERTAAEVDQIAELLGPREQAVIRTRNAIPPTWRLGDLATVMLEFAPIAGTFNQAGFQSPSRQGTKKNQNLVS